ncbi:MAG: TRAP transporter small permease [Comamonadaceae bacterium]|nr:TRAP transporter small permease [Comamonadaceae bacterium]
MLFIVIGVGFRYGLNRPMVWGEELMIGLFVWLVFVGASAAMRTCSHIRLDVLGGLAAKAWLRWLAPATVLLALGILAVLVYTSMEYVGYERLAYSPTLNISRAWFVAAMPVGFACMMLHLLRRWIQWGAVQGFQGLAPQVTQAAGQSAAVPEDQRS